METIIQRKKATTEEALALFDRLETVDLDLMLGRWQGFGIETNHLHFAQDTPAIAQAWR